MKLSTVRVFKAIVELLQVLKRKSQCGNMANLSVKEIHSSLVEDYKVEVSIIDTKIALEILCGCTLEIDAGINLFEIYHNQKLAMAVRAPRDDLSGCLGYLAILEAILKYEEAHA